MKRYPMRLQRKRVRGWRAPAGSIIVTRPTKWGNPFKVGIHGNSVECVRLFRAELLAQDAAWARRIKADVEELRGKDLLCWCKLGRACHANILLEFANYPPQEWMER